MSRNKYHIFRDNTHIRSLCGKHLAFLNRWCVIGSWKFLGNGVDNDADWCKGCTKKLSPLEQLSLVSL